MITHSRRWFLATFSLLLVAALPACDSSRKPKESEALRQDAVWSRYISARTAGLISKKAKLHVVFVNDVIREDMVGKSAESVIATDPPVEGKTTFTSTREIVLAPETGLKPGQQYRVTVDPQGLLGIPEKLQEYQFVVQVIKQQFEVNLAGLATNPANDREMVLRGSVVTADVEDADRLEKMLTVGFMDKPLKIEWRHNVDGKHHDFSVGGIRRQDREETVHLAWDGSIIGVDAEGRRDVEVPARNVFKVTKVGVVQGNKPHVAVYFSDSLDARQDLKGLVRLSKGAYRSRVESNALKIYPDKAIEGKVTVTLEPGIRNIKGERLRKRVEKVVSFASQKPQVRFVGKGVILPENKILSVPFEAVNVHSVQVTAFRVYENNIGQFLQTNKLGGNRELGRVGRYLWRRTIKLSSPEPDNWNRYSLDVTELLKAHPGGLFRLTLSTHRGNSLYPCSQEERAVPVAKESPLQNNEDLHVKEASSWDYAEDYYGVNNDRSGWRDRGNPCKDAYYQFAAGVKDAQNFLASNIGILAKRDQRGNVLVVTTDLRTSKPMKGAKVSLMNFQDQPIGRASTDANGFAKTKPAGTPFYLVAENDGQKGYLKMSAGSALPVSHFDVGGEKVTAGIKGYIYGERGVWRPGDDIFLTFVLQDKDDAIPANHPVTMQLFSPKGRLIQSMTNSAPVGDFYAFRLNTPEDAPTGNWTVKARLGGSMFTKTLKIETVVPNRLKVELDFGKNEKLQSAVPLRGQLSAQWLNGATAADLDADVKVRLVPAGTRFDRFADFVFDDPAREFRGEPQVVFEGKLDGHGRASFEKELTPGSDAPGMLSAHFTLRVFEKSGAFSTSRRTIPFSPYEHYVGIKLPKGDEARGMLLTDTVHTVELASLSANGKAVSLKNIQVSLYKVNWKWWWDKSGESLAQYASASHRSVVKQERVSTVNGKGVWRFEIKYPSWGRYLVRACDLDGKHCTGKVFYIDWPGWAGRAQEQGGPGANVLSFFSDKQRYRVGEVAKIRLPEATQGRALVTIENGSTILEQRWIEFAKDEARFEVPIKKTMSPNAYVSVTLIQPHEGKKNDRPIRLYGVIPLVVDDPETRLQPVLKAADEWAPESSVSIDVSEAKGREMTYTVAVVDEGLLGLTSFKTPDLHGHFYTKEALGITTWDLFDEVAGAYGGELERLLALGGGGSAEQEEAKEDKRRFPPVVKFLGPFKLKAKEKNKHQLKLPQYVGAVRVMVVAGERGAYGSAEKSVYVRQPLTLLVTLPRVIGPGEDLTVPVSLFVMEAAIKHVTLQVETDEHFDVAGGDAVTVDFAKPGEKLSFLNLKVKPNLGKGRLRFTARSGRHHAKSEIYIDVRGPNPPTVRQQRKAIKPGETWEAQVVPHGLPNTNTVSLEVSAVPPLNLERRLNYLIRYPHGCVEQVTSAVFPQLYLPALVKLDAEKKKEIEKNVQAGVDRLRGFQVPSGAFAYWPGGFVGQATFDARNAWATNYVGHFLVEAEKVGYQVPAEMLADWMEYQKSTARAWTAGSGSSVLDQAYRLYTLALANQPEMGAMNRLRESADLTSVARWQLAAAYRLAGQVEAAEDLVKNDRFAFEEYVRPGFSFGSALRDKAIVMNSLVVLAHREKARSFADEISEGLSADRWHSTHAIAYALLAMAKYIGAGDVESFAFERRIGKGGPQTVKPDAPIYTAELKGFPLAGETVAVRNTSERVLFASIVVKGTPKAGEEVAASSGLDIDVAYTDLGGSGIDIGQLPQGTDFIARVTVANRTRVDLDNLALTHVVASGWEIHNPRFDDGDSGKKTKSDYQDIRDDRVYTYFGLKAGESKTFAALFNAAYLGKYYLPSVSVEAMYDASKTARTKGRWIEVVQRGP